MGGLVEAAEDTAGDLVDAGGDLIDAAGDVVSDVGDAVGDVVSDINDTVGGVVSDVGDAVGDVVGGVGDAVGDVVSGVTDAVGDVVEKVGDVVTGIVEDPKKLAAVAISIYFPGAGLAIGESLLGPTLAASMGAAATQIVGQTLINTAINGGDVEKALLTAGVSVMTPALAKEISAEAVKQGVTQTIADAGAKVAAGTVSAAALGRDPMVALTFGAVDQATNAVLNNVLSESGLTKEYNALSDAAKIAVSASIKIGRAHV